MPWTTVLPLIFTAISVLFCILTYFNNAKKDAVKDTKDIGEEHANQVLISYRLGQVEGKLDKIIETLDNYRKELSEEVKRVVGEEIEKHIALYHKKTKSKN